MLVHPKAPRDVLRLPVRAIMAGMEVKKPKEAEKPKAGADTGWKIDARPALPLLILSAIGVVFGDIATSPLYSLQTAFGD